MIVHFDPKPQKFNKLTTILTIECFIDTNQAGRVFFVVLEGFIDCYKMYLYLEQKYTNSFLRPNSISRHKLFLSCDGRVVKYSLY